MTPAAREACAVLHRAGWSTARIAELAGRHPTTIWRALKAAGVNPPGRWG